MKIKIISTFSDKGYEEYGKHFVESCKKFVSRDIDICLYIDNINLQSENNITILNLEESAPNLTKFKERNKEKTFKDWHHDAVRFSHKTYATFHSVDTSLDYLIWLDSDTEIYDIITPEYLLNLLPKGNFVGYLGREKVSETGFLIFDMKHPSATDFFDRYQCTMIPILFTVCPNFTMLMFLILLEKNLNILIKLKVITFLHRI